MRYLGGNPKTLWARRVAKVRKGERALEKAMTAEFVRVAKEARAALASGDDAIADMSAHRKRVLAILTRAYEGQMPDAANEMLKPIKAKAPKTFDELMQAWIKANAGAKAKEISLTTRSQIKRAIAQAADEGLGQAQTARLVSQRAAAIGRVRAQVIARTEMNSAASAAQQIAAESLDVPMKREWVAANDERTREDHRRANGQVRDLGKPFKVGKSRLMYPGDPSGDPSQTINCRCVLAYVLTD